MHPDTKTIPLRSLRLHAEQLATHFSSLSNDLDRREAEIAAEQACRERELRTMRMWVSMRVTHLQELVGRLRDQANHMQSIRGSLKGKSAKHLATHAASTMGDSDLTSVEQQLQSIELHLENYPQQILAAPDSSDTGSSNTMAPEAAPVTSDELAERTAALDFRERTLESARRELEVAYHETKEICESAESLLHGATENREDNPSTTQGARPSLVSQTRAMEKAEIKLQRMYAQVLHDRKKQAAINKAVAPPAWERERDALIEQIDQLQAALYTAQKSPRRAA